jgi:hypothetical protein
VDSSKNMEDDFKDHPCIGTAKDSGYAGSKKK